MISPERQFAEDAALVMETMGLSRAQGKLLSWLLVCDPPQQSGTQLARALDLSAGSISSATRMLENARLIRRVAVPGTRGKVYEMIDDAFIRAAQDERLDMFCDLMDKGIAVIGSPDAPRARRLRRTRDYYAFMVREIPHLIKRFEAEYGEGGSG
jgi:DNA-binding MarR family transcriptional regulator